MKDRELEYGTFDRKPPRAFLEKLHRQDPDLEVRWDNDCSRWTLWHWADMPAGERRISCGLYVYESKPHRELNYVCTVRNPDGSYLDLGDAVLEWLRRADSWGINMDDYLAHREEVDRKAKEIEEARQIEETRSEILDITRSPWWAIRDGKLPKFCRQENS